MHLAKGLLRYYILLTTELVCDTVWMHWEGYRWRKTSFFEVKWRSHADAFDMHDPIVLDTFDICQETSFSASTSKWKVSAMSCNYILWSVSCYLKPINFHYHVWEIWLPFQMSCHKGFIQKILNVLFAYGAGFPSSINLLLVRDYGLWFSDIYGFFNTEAFLEIWFKICFMRCLSMQVWQMRTGPRLLTIPCSKGSKILQPTYRFGSSSESASSYVPLELFVLNGDSGQLSVVNRLLNWTYLLSSVYIFLVVLNLIDAVAGFIAMDSCIY